MTPPCDFQGVLSGELEEIRARRRALFPDQQPLTDAPAAELPFSAAHGVRPLGLALSGAGVRSATFHLGVLQGLAELGLLPFIDYLSTVSGGGYIGSWLHAIIRNKHSGDPVSAQRELLPGRVPGQAAHDPITFLSEHRTYLTPRLGLFSPAFWSTSAVWIRNMSLNLLIVIAFLMAVVLTVLLCGILQQRFGGRLESGFRFPFGVVALAVAVAIIGVNLRQIVFAQFPHLKPRFRLPDLTGRGMVGLATVCILFAAYIFGAFGLEFEPVVTGILLFQLFAMAQWVGGFRLSYAARHGGSSGWLFLIAIPLFCAAVTTTLMWFVWRLTSTWFTPDVEWVRIAVGPPMLLIVWMFGTVLQVGLMGWDFPAAAREWLDRLRASVSIATTAWIGLFVLAVFGPYWLARLTLTWQPAGPALLGGWILSRAAGYLMESSEKGKAGTGNKALEVWAKVAPVLFLAGSLLVVSLGTHILLRAIALHVDCRVPVVRKIPDWLLWLEPVEREYWCFLYFANDQLLRSVAMLLAACGAIVAIFPLRLNINEFSMHHFDKNRLVSFYLGASRQERNPNRLTGFDPHDDFPIAALMPSDPVHPYLGPYPIVNCALSLNTRSELAGQERRTVSFVFTPRYCGFVPPRSQEDRLAVRRIEDLSAEGYRTTPGYMQPSGPGLGTAMAISGAGTNPNTAQHSSKPVAFLMSILSLRLGWWLGNPRRDAPSARPGPKNALLTMLSELFAQSTGHSRYVNVSDGGSFDNLGLYELVRRRCRYIIVSDSEAEPALGLEGLGGAIRKCRADLGVEITIDTEPIRLNGDRSRAHCLLGTITYPEMEAAPAAAAPGTGWLLYLKAGVTGDEPEDVQQYRARSPEFPREGPGNEAFSEAEFESYRELGLHVVRSTFENVATRPSSQDERCMLEMFLDLSRKLHPAPSFSEGKAGKLTEQYSALLRRMSADPELAFLDSQLFDGMPPAEQPQATPRKAVYFCMELIQFMEDVFVELNAQRRGDRENPAYAGWHRVFRTWANSQAFRDAWKVAGNAYNPPFQEYFEGYWE